ncbi:MAG: response regulator [Candidatus Schekmanbacteria bacterium]|nr:response regulator [Candidatus Schekmanbacteria bacterium]
MAGESILIVDDSPINLKLLRVLLAGAGYEVRAARDTEEARAILASFSPALIFMDLQLPGMDGYELTRRLKAAPATAGITVVAVTSYAMKGDEEKAREAGCDEYVTKPIDTQGILDLVERLLGARDKGEGGRA